jgi:WXG100 family type VII secretion target
MADIIKVSTEELRSAANKFSTCQQELQTAYLTMSNAVRALDGSYDGDASEAFKAQFDAMYKNIEQTQDKVQDAVDELKKAADIYDEVEQTLAGTFNSLDTGTTPFNA